MYEKPGDEDADNDNDEVEEQVAEAAVELQPSSDLSASDPLTQAPADIDANQSGTAAPWHCFE